MTEEKRSDERRERLQREIVGALRHQAANGGRHLHHRECIHNLPPVQQIEVCGKTVEWWTRLVGALPVQITAADWECEPPNLAALGGEAE